MVLFVWKTTSARAAIVALAALAGAAGLGASSAEGEAEATVEVRIYQRVADARDIYVGARPAGGSWRTLGAIRLPLDSGFSPKGRYRYGDIALDVPLPNRASPAPVEVWVWQDVGNSRNILINARPAGGAWSTLGTIRLPLDDGLDGSGRFRYGDFALGVPLPETLVATLAELPTVPAWIVPQREAQVGYLRFGLEFDRDGSVVVADRANGAIRRILSDGTAHHGRRRQWGWCA